MKIDNKEIEKRREQVGKVEDWVQNELMTFDLLL